MNKGPFKLILCDLGNVLINFDHRIAARRMLPYTDRNFAQIYRFFFDSALTREFEEGRLSPGAFFRRIKKALDLKNLTLGSFLDIWNDIFFENEGILDILKRLKKTHTLHLVSNVNEAHFDFIQKRFPVHLKVFDRIFLSYEIGRSKPHAAFYKKAVQASGFAFKETIYVDDREDLIKEAAKLGLTVVLFKGLRELKNQLKSLKVPV